MRYDWQDDQWQKLWAAHQENRLPHALLFSGIAGTGKRGIAFYLAQALLCKEVSSDGKVCGHCHDCHMSQGKTHPNIYTVQPEKEGHAIKVDQIRALADFVNQSSIQGQYRVVIIYPAQSMNVNAANALLKTLEEPSQGAVIILVTEQYGYLPATVLSRCQRLMFAKPDQEKALTWLKSQIDDNACSHEQLLAIANGAPLLARDMLAHDVLTLRQDVFAGMDNLLKRSAYPVEIAAKWASLELKQVLDLMNQWVSDVLRLQLTGNEEHIHNQDHMSAIRQAANKVSQINNLHALKLLQDANKSIVTGANLNKQLLLEQTLATWVGSHD